MNCLKMQKGAVLGLVLTALVIMTLFVTTLLKMPGGIRRQVPRFEKRLQSIYSAESAIIAELEQFPSEYFRDSTWSMDLPQVEARPAGLWLEISAPVYYQGRETARVSALAGAGFRLLGISELASLAETFGRDLSFSIMNQKDLISRSGSRRLIGKVQRQSMVIAGGDLTLDLEGKSSSLNFKCDGSATVKGSVEIDTLRLYATGAVTLSGTVQVRHLELYAGDMVELSREVSFSGLVLGKNGVTFRGKSSMEFPAMAASLGGVVSVESNRLKNYCGVETANSSGDELSRRNAGSLTGKVRVVAARRNPSDGSSPSGFRHIPLDSQECLLPASVGGKLQPFRWRMD